MYGVLPTGFSIDPIVLNYLSLDVTIFLKISLHIHMIFSTDQLATISKCNNHYNTTEYNATQYITII